MDLAGCLPSCAAVAARAPQLPSKLGGPGLVATWPGGKASPKGSVAASVRDSSFGTASTPTKLLTVALVNLFCTLRY